LADSDSRDAAQSTTARLILALLAGNLLSVFCVGAFRPFAGSFGSSAVSNLVLTVGVMSLVTAGLLFLASAMRRRSAPWWFVTIGLNVIQVVRLIPAIVAIAGWAETEQFAGILWTLVFVPFLGVLAAVGIIMTIREVRKGRRRRLSHAA
jgi:hypothetical protein